MTSQVGATKRNSQAEIFVDHLLKMYCEQMSEQKAITDYDVITQAAYKSDISSDVWDHKVTFHDTALDKDVELWCQTTCYKGHGDVKKREPNKSYEVKETLVEAISIRKLIDQKDKIVRTIHFTVGDVNYTYGWFKSLKEKSFDLSIYLDTETVNIFEILNESIGSMKIEFQIRNALSSMMRNNKEINAVVSSALTSIQEWHIDDSLPIQDIAQAQWNIVKNNSLATPIDNIIKNAENSGFDVKKQASEAIHRGYSDDSVIEETVENLLSKKPALKKLYYVKNNWEDYCSKVNAFSQSAPDLRSFVKELWSNSDLKEVYRRLLLRVHTNQGVDYIQDIDVDGISEHNLYTGKHTALQVDQLVDYIAANFLNEGISTVQDLCSCMTEAYAKNMVRACLWFEARNGTALKPSFEYICIKLRNLGYTIEKPRSLDNLLTGYHSKLTHETVKPYQNFMGVFNSDEELVALIKGKFFSRAEFPRRCKEESFTGLTMQNDFTDNILKKRHNLPIIMFIDMLEDYTPPEFSLKRLSYFGWTIAFNESEIVDAIANE